MFIHKRAQRFTIAVLLVCFVVVFVGSAALIPRQAQAQGVPTVEGPGPLLATIVQEPVRLSVWQSIWASAIVGVVSAVTLFAQQMAFDLASGLASGCKGENPCAFTSDPGTYFTQLGYDAAGEFLGSLSGPWEELGLNLCNPRIPDVGLAISLGIAYGFQRPTPRCDFAATINNWDQVAREASDPHALLKHASLSFDIGQSDISQAFQAQEAFKIQYQRRLKAAEIKRLEGGGILPKEGLIGGTVDTPAEVMAENFRGLARTGEKSRQPPDSGELLGAVGGGDVWLAAGRTVLSTFFNTLVSRIIQSTLQGLFEPARETLPNLIELVTGGAERVAGGIGRLSRVARGLLTPTIRTSTDEFEYVSELAACPAQGKSEWNCTIDRQFQIAIQRAQTGEPLTVEQAIAARLLDGAKPFGFVDPQKGIEPTVSEGYPYSSMKKLRLLRVIPVGWEFAALKIESGGVTYTLREVVDGWNKTGPDGVCGGGDDESPFCGLVDPNWILKAPAAVCAARAFGERLDASGTGRQEACVDLKHCVATDESGNCRAQGYCTREQNIWRFDGDACPAQFASCDVFTRAGGRGAAAQLAVLENTVDFGVCNADNAGCAAYATRRSGPGGDWSTGSGAPRMYFDGNAQQCNAAASGCTELIEGARASINLVNNGSFETDADGNGYPDGWVRIPSVHTYLRGPGDAHHGSGAMFIRSGLAGAMNSEQGYSIAASQDGQTIGSTASDEDKEPQTAGDDTADSPLRRRSTADDDTKDQSPAGGRPTGGRTISPPVKDGAPVKGADQDAGGKQPSGPAPVSYNALQTLDQTISLTAGKTYTVSLFAKLSEGASYNAANPPRLQMTFAGLGTANMRGRPTDCDVVGDRAVTEFIPATAQYQRFSCTFSMPFADPSDVDFRIGTLRIEVPSGMAVAGLNVLDHLISPVYAQEGLGLIVDALQIEEGTAPTDYHDGYAYVGTPQNVYYRLPPEYLGCTGEEGEPSQCANYSWICRPAEVGCERYTPRGGDPAIPGIATALDRCPDGCAGYDAYLKQESRFEPQFASENPYLLIAQNAAACSAPEAGCDEFTNLRTEAREYFTDLRACQLPGPTSKTYFTWEGSETSGYQIKAWNLKQSEAGAIGGVDDINRADSATPPCTNYAIAVGAEGRITVDCTDSGTPSNQATCDPNDDSATLAERADCRGFYDEHGNIFYRKLSRTILSTEECQNYRWTGLTQPPNVTLGTNETPDQARIRLERQACDAAHGFWNTTTSECIFTGAPSSSNSCRAAVSGCRGYKGSGGANVRQVISDDMESQEGWSAHIATTEGIIETPIELSGESLQPGRHSLKVPGASYALRSIPRINSAEPALIQGATYFARAVVKGTAGSRAQVLVYSPNLLGSRGSFEALPIFGTVDLTPEWKYIELGPLVLDSIPQDTLSLMFLVNRGTATADQIVFFIDDLVLREVRDTVYLVKNSLLASVPASCDFLPAEAGGGYSPGAMLGCREYRDRANAPQHLTGFSSLCRDRSVGCQEFVDTRGTLSPFEETFVTPNQETNNTEDDVTTPADTRRYIVRDDASLKVCRAEEKGCAEVGRIDAAGNVASAYLRNDPTRYGSDLCAIEAVGCAAWNRSGGSQAYFKDPLQAGGACEWRENVVIGNSAYSGWFDKDKKPLDDPDGLYATRGACGGFGRWDPNVINNGVAGACIGSDGTPLCRRGVPGGDRLPGGLNCQREQCEKGAGGQWREPSGDSTGACLMNAPCYGVVETTDAGIIQIRQVETYLTGGSTFGIWRNGDQDYAGRVGMCPAQEATCAEFVDPTDTSDSPLGKAYHRKDNERLVQARRDCEGGVSRQQGCVLFDNTEDPREIYSTSLTYASSEAAGGDAVSPESNPSRQFYCIGGAHDDRPCHGFFEVENGVSDSACTAGGGQCGRRNDTNVLLKVARDRECAEWLQCSRAQFEWSEQDQKMVTRCLGIGRCAEIPLPAAVGGPALEQCGRPITQPEPSVCIGGTHDSKHCTSRLYGEGQITPRECLSNGGRCVPQPLTDEHYQTRNRTFFGAEYLGYAIPNWRPLEKLQEINFGTIEQPNYNLFFADVSCTALADCAHLEGSWCDPNVGRCVAGRASSSQLCRGFPEATSPFPNTTGNVNVPGTGTRERTVFANAPKCEISQGASVSNTEVIACGCNYEKAEYGRGNFRYYPEGAEDDDLVPSELDGQTRSGIFTVRGWQGFCIDEDTAPHSRIYNDPNRRACLTWWPIDQLRSAQDIYNQFEEAGYQIPDVGGQFWCLEGKGSTRVILLNNSPQGVLGERQRIAVSRGDDAALIRTIRVDPAVNISKEEISAIVITLSHGPSASRQRVFMIPAGSAAQDRLVVGQTYTTEETILAGTREGDVVEISLSDFGFTELTEGLFEAFDARTDQDWWWWALDDNASDDSNPDNPDRHFDRASGEREHLESDALSSVVSALRVEGPSLDELIYDDNNTNDLTRECDTDILPWTDPDDNDYDAVAAMLKFGEDQKLTHLRLAYCSTGNDAGGADDPLGDNQSGVHISVTLFLNGQCTTIAQIDPNTSAPWTQRLWSNEPAPKYQVQHQPPGWNYVYNTLLPPFGSSSSQDPPPERGGDNSPWLINVNAIDDANTRRFSGLPYSCSESGYGAVRYENAYGVCVGASQYNGGPCDIQMRERNFFPTLNEGGLPVILDSGIDAYDENPSLLEYNFEIDTSADVERPYFPVENGLENTNVMLRANNLSTVESIPEDQRIDFYLNEMMRILRTRGDYNYAPILSNLDIIYDQLHREFNVRDARPLFITDHNRLCEFFGGTCMTRTDSFNQCRVAQSVVPDGQHAFPLLANDDARTWGDVVYSPLGGYSFSNLFARGNTIFTWQPGSNPWRGQYNESSTNWIWNTVTQHQLRPTVHGITVSAPEATNLAGNLVGHTGFLNVAIDFYAEADKDHMPIRRVAIDWDDGTQTVTNGLYKNHLPTGQCNGQEFGHQSGVSCVERPFSYETTYICEQGVGPNWVDNCPEPSVRGGCCVFRPAVQVQDNWGYCNGTCIVGSNVACLDSQCNAPWNRVAPEEGPWTPVPQSIYVISPQRVRE